MEKPAAVPDAIIATDDEAPAAPSGSPLTSSLPALGWFGLAFVQPVLDQLGRNLPFLIHHELDPVGIGLLLSILVLWLPGALVLTASLADKLAGQRAMQRLVLTAIGCLGGAWMLRLARLAGVDWPTVAFALAIAFGGALTWATVKLRPVRWFSALCAFGLPLFALLFLSRPSILGFVVEHFVPAYPRVETATDTPVVMVVFDEFPLLSLLDEDRGIDARLYPNFAFLASEATWYRNATTLHWRTEESLVTILTGSPAQVGAAPILTNYPRNLFTLLAQSHDVQATEQVTQLLPSEYRPPATLRDRLRRQYFAWRDLGVLYAHMILPPPLAGRLPPLDHWANFLRLDGTLDEPPTGSELVVARDAFERDKLLDGWLTGIGPYEAKPPLHFLHVFLPHAPFRYLPSGKQYSGRTTLGPRTIQEAWETDPFYVDQTYLRHLLQVRYVDAFVGRLRQRLESTGLWHRSLVVLVADHGVSHWPGRARRNPEAGAPEADDILRIPLFVKAPGQRTGLIDDRNFQTVDLLPTMVDLLGIDPAEIGWSFAGRSASGPPRPVRWMVTKSGELRRLTLAFEPTAAGLERKRLLFGDTGDSVQRMFAFGPHRQFVGRSLEALPIAAAIRFHTQLDQRAALEDYDPASAYAPVQLTGRLELPSEAAAGGTCTPKSLGFVVNGTLEAVAQVRLHGDCRRGLFSALLPESKLRPGRNAVKIFLVEDSDAGPRFHPPAS